jgi:hypothetical protein
MMAGVGYNEEQCRLKWHVVPVSESELSGLDVVRYGSASIVLLSPDLVRALMTRVVDMLDSESDLTEASCFVQARLCHEAQSPNMAVGLVVGYRLVVPETGSVEKGGETPDLVANNCERLCCAVLGYYSFLAQHLMGSLPSSFRVLSPAQMYRFLEDRVFPVHRQGTQRRPKRVAYCQLRTLVQDLSCVRLSTGRWQRDRSVYFSCCSLLS